MRRLFSLFNVVSLALLAASVLAHQAVQKPPETPRPPKLELLERTPVKVKVYFTDPQVQRLKAEERTVNVTQKDVGTLAQAALNVWAKGPSGKDLLSVVPAGTAAPRVYYRSAHYYVDFPEAYGKLRYGTSGERMLLCTVTRTLLELKGQDVTFLLGGKNVDTLGHLDLREAFAGQDCAD